MAAASPVERGQAAREGLEKRVRARVVEARGDVGVLPSKDLRQLLRGQRNDVRPTREPFGGATDEGQLVPRRFDPLAERAQGVAALARVVRPAHGDDAERPAAGWLAVGGGVEDRGIRRVRDHDGLGQVDAEPPMRLQAEPRLEYGRIRELGVHRRDPAVGAVVEAAVDADRAVDAVHHPHVVAGEPAQTREVEVERVEEAAGRAARDAVLLDGQAAARELLRERTEELVAAAGRWRRVLVEEREIGAAGAGGAKIAFRPGARTDPGERGAGMDERGAGLRAECHDRRTVDV